MYEEGFIGAVVGVIFTILLLGFFAWAFHINDEIKKIENLETRIKVIESKK